MLWFKLSDIDFRAQTNDTFRNTNVFKYELT